MSTAYTCCCTFSAVIMSQLIALSTNIISGQITVPVHKGKDEIDEHCQGNHKSSMGLVLSQPDVVVHLSLGIVLM